MERAAVQKEAEPQKTTESKTPAWIYGRTIPDKSGASTPKETEPVASHSPQSSTAAGSLRPSFIRRSHGRAQPTNVGQPSAERNSEGKAKAGSPLSVPEQKQFPSPLHHEIHSSMPKDYEEVAGEVKVVRSEEELASEGPTQEAVESVDNDEDLFEAVAAGSQVTSKPFADDTESIPEAASAPAAVTNAEQGGGGAQGPTSSSTNIAERDPKTKKEPTSVRGPRFPNKISALQDAMVKRLTNLLRDYEWRDGFQSQGVAVDDCILLLEFWAQDSQVDEKGRARVYEYDEDLYAADHAAFADVYRRIVAVEKEMAREQGPLETHSALAIEELERAVRGSTKSAAAHKVLMDFDGQVAKLRTRLRTIEDWLAEGHEAEGDAKGQATNEGKEAAILDPNLSPEGSVVEPLRSAPSPPPLDTAVPGPEMETHEAGQPQSRQEDHAPVSVQEPIRLKIQTAILEVFDDVLDDLFQKDEPLPARSNSLPAMTKSDRRD